MCIPPLEFKYEINLNIEPIKSQNCQSQRSEGRAALGAQADPAFRAPARRPLMRHENEDKLIFYAGRRSDETRRREGREG